MVCFSTFKIITKLNSSAMAQDFFDEVKMHAKKQGLDHMGVSLLERHSVSFTTHLLQYRCGER